MSNLFRNKFRIPSARLQSWNYANEAMYFVTICTHNRQNFFGEIIEKKLRPTTIGEMAYSEWYKSVEMRPDMNLALGEFVVMPNHIHGIIMIGANEFNTGVKNGGADDAENGGAVGRDAMNCVSTVIKTAIPTPTTPTTPTPTTTDTTNENQNQFGPQSKNLASILRGYKSAVTTFARKNGIEFGWQTRFHDHIIRSIDDYHRISNYIMNNPAKWKEDRFNEF